MHTCFLHLYNLLLFVLSGLVYFVIIFLVGWWGGLVLFEQHQCKPVKSVEIRPGSGAEAEETTARRKETETIHPFKPLCSVAVRSQEKEGGGFFYRFIYVSTLTNHFFFSIVFTVRATGTFFVFRNMRYYKTKNLGPDLIFIWIT